MPFVANSALQSAICYSSPAVTVAFRLRLHALTTGHRDFWLLLPAASFVIMIDIPRSSLRTSTKQVPVSGLNPQPSLEVIVMADQHTEVTRSGYLHNVWNSFLGALFGVLLFCGSFVVLWINEGSVNLATIAQQSTPLVAASVDPAVEGRLVAATGRLASAEKLGDDLFLRPAGYLALERRVEMYAWVEETRSSTEKNAGGSSSTKTTYTYEKKWTASPERSSSFRYPDGHHNPELPFSSQIWKVSSAVLGAYRVDPRTLTLPESTPVTLNEENVSPRESWLLRDGYLINNERALSEPRIGDLRVSYAAVPNNLDVTLFGKASAGQILPFEAQGSTLYRAFTEDRAGAIATLDTEYHLWLWIWRVAGFLMMWIGLSLAFEPINTLLDLLPLLGGASRFVINSILLVIALLLSILTVIVSIIAHNIFLLIGLLLLLLGGIVAWNRLRKPRVAVAPA
jgi:hypothetical protein